MISNKPVVTEQYSDDQIRDNIEHVIGALKETAETITGLRLTIEYIFDVNNYNSVIGQAIVEETKEGGIPFFGRRIFVNTVYISKCRIVFGYPSFHFIRCVVKEKRLYDHAKNVLEALCGKIDAKLHMVKDYPLDSEDLGYKQ